MTTLDDIKFLIHQHASQLMIVGLSPEHALQAASRLCVLAFDDEKLRGYLKSSAIELGVQPILADLPRTTQIGGASMALTKNDE